jgi:hypothetical protein
VQLKMKMGLKTLKMCVKKPASSARGRDRRVGPVGGAVPGPEHTQKTLSPAEPSEKRDRRPGPTDEAKVGGPATQERAHTGSGLSKEGRDERHIQPPGATPLEDVLTTLMERLKARQDRRGAACDANGLDSGPE